VSTSYRTTRTDRFGVVCCASPEAIRGILRSDNRWPSGCYEITGVESLFGHPRHRWGVAVKLPDGTVELIRDRPA
jgi:hypothetical protein